MDEKNQGQNKTSETSKETAGTAAKTNRSSTSTAKSAGSGTSTDEAMGLSSTTERKSASGASTSTSSDGLEGIIKLIQNVGMNEELWRGYLGDALAKRVKEADLKDAASRVRDLASLSADKIKTSSTKNPGLFYAGVAAIVVGAGLVARAVRDEKVDEPMTDFPGGGADMAH
jgi:hypothetical protein